MQLSETVKLYPTKYQKELIFATMDEYINTVNSLVYVAINGTSISKYTTADINCNLPSALANQCIRDAKSIVKKHYKSCHKTILANRKQNKKSTVPKLPILRKPCCYINNQNFSVNSNSIDFPVMINGKSKRISVYAKLTARQQDLFNDAKFGTMRIVVKNNSVVAQIVYNVDEPVYPDDGNIMGVDLGIKCPAVSYCSDGSAKFYGNGRKNKYIRRHYKYLRTAIKINYMTNNNISWSFIIYIIKINITIISCYVIICNFITSIQTKFYIIIIIFYTFYFIFHISYIWSFLFLYIFIIAHCLYNSCIFYLLFTTRNMYVL